MKRLAMAALIGLVNAPPSVAQEKTVGEMVPHCERAASLVYRSEDELAGGAYCLGVLTGAQMVMALNCSTATSGTFAPHPGLSTGANFAAGALAQAFANWARAHPERWGDPFTSGAASTLAESYPCSAN